MRTDGIDMVDRKAEQKTGMKRLWEQTVGLFKWIEVQVRSNPLQSIPVTALSLTLCWLTWRAYRSDNMGFDNKTFWDWMELLIVPVVLATAAWWLNKTQKETERGIAKERHQQSVLQDYFDRMTNLLLKHGLWGSQPRSEVRRVARSRTLAVLRSMDGMRKGQVVYFLADSDLIWRGASEGAPPVDVFGADLSRADLEDMALEEIYLESADLSRGRLRQVNLCRSNLGGVHLNKADLRGALLRHTCLRGADLTKADLRDADLRGADLHTANLGAVRIARAKYDEHTRWPDGFEVAQCKATFVADSPTDAES